jgi:hypothetical protein
MRRYSLDYVLDFVVFFAGANPRRDNTPMHSIRLFLVLLFFASTLAGLLPMAHGASLPSALLPPVNQPEINEKPEVEKASLGCESPRDSFENFVKAVDTGNYKKASQYLKAQPGKTPEQIKELISQFQTLLDRGYLGSMDDINDDILGNLADGLNPHEESAGQIQVGQEALDIKLIRLKTAEGRELWFISEETIREIPSLYAKMEKIKLPIELPGFLKKHPIWNTPVHIWLIAVILLPLLWGFFWILIHSMIFSVRLIKKLFHRPLKGYPFKAAQKSIENLFGGVSLLNDQAIRVGDFCKIGDRLGTVEDISLRSTKLRTLERTFLYVPNGSLAVENFTQRDKYWFHHFMGLRYETGSDQIH